jgi:hypothetical protein
MAKQKNGHAPRDELLAALPKPDQSEKEREAEAVLEAARQARGEEFMQKLQALCKQYRCELVPVFQLKAH